MLDDCCCNKNISSVFFSPKSMNFYITLLFKQVKQRCEVLEEQLVDLVVIAMERSENEDASKDDSGFGQLLWQHLGSQLIFFVLFQFVSFPHMVMSLYEKVSSGN